MNRKTLWITTTGVLLALLVAAQWVTKPLGTIVTGTAVNFLLLAATLLAGIASGLVVAVVSPFLALLLGIVPLPLYIVPVVALGNAVLVVCCGLLLKLCRDRSRWGKVGIWIGTIAAGSLLKFGALYAGVNWLVVPLVTAVTGAPAKAPAAVFSTQQMLTAALGGILSMLVVPVLLRAIRRNSTFSQNNL